jgi:NAD(P)-dependent dehydrogenase (short-subunit alcohol dehydrogenase family)
MPPYSLQGKTLFITGGASGIGAEVARQASAKGAKLALVDVNGDAAEQMAASLPNAIGITADVRDYDSLEAAVEQTVSELGGIDVAVANAGIATGGPLRLVGPDTVTDTLDVNLLGVWRTVRASLPHVVERRGHLLLVASAAAVLPAPGLGAYAAAKAGVEALGRSLRIEVRHLGVTVGVAYYLFLKTPMVDAGEASPVFQAAKRRFAGPIGKTWPLEPAIDRTVSSIERRSRGVAHPPFLRGLMMLRGVLDNSLTDRVVGASFPAVEEAFAREAERVGPDEAARAVGRGEGRGPHPSDGERPPLGHLR